MTWLVAAAPAAEAGAAGAEAGAAGAGAAGAAAAVPVAAGAAEAVPMGAGGVAGGLGANMSAATGPAAGATATTAAAPAVATPSMFGQLATGLMDGLHGKKFSGEVGMNPQFGGYLAGALKSRDYSNLAALRMKGSSSAPSAAGPPKVGSMGKH